MREIAVVCLQMCKTRDLWIKNTLLSYSDLNNNVKYTVTNGAPNWEAFPTLRTLLEKIKEVVTRD